jgi:hypothetical protein
MVEEKRLSTLPVDAQTSILAFLSHGDLVLFSRVSKQCLGVANMKRLWISLISRHVADVALPISQYFSIRMNSAYHFRALVRKSCSVCSKHLLPTEPREEPTRYLHPYVACVGCYAARRVIANAIASEQIVSLYLPKAPASSA